MEYLHDELRGLFGLAPETDLDKASRQLAESLTAHYMAIFAMYQLRMRGGR